MTLDPDGTTCLQDNHLNILQSTVINTKLLAISYKNAPLFDQTQTQHSHIFSKMQQKTVILLVVGFVLFASSCDARSVPLEQARAKRDLTDEQREYLAYLYNRFEAVFRDSYRRTANSQQFAVATINQPDNLEPCSLVMNDDQGTISSSNNYLAYTPRPSQTRPGGQQHAENRIIQSFGDATRGVSVRTVYIVTHFSPCRVCSNMLRNFVRNHPSIIFYIGYREVYQNEDNLNYFIDQVGRQPNVQQGRLTQPSNPTCHDELRRKRSTTCPVKPTCGQDGGCFPGNALVNTNDMATPMKKMEDLDVGDEVLTMNSEGKMLYSPVIAFLDREASTGSQVFIEIQTENHRKLQLTPEHLIFTDNLTEPVYASDVKVGDSVFTVDPSGNGNQLASTPSKVISIKSISSIGLYAPLTDEGTIIVDGVLASCYAEVDAPQSYIHSFFGPLRFLYSIAPQKMIEAQEEGVHWYAKGLIHAYDAMKTYLPNSIQTTMMHG